jgi:hypothetical protein
MYHQTVAEVALGARLASDVGFANALGGTDNNPSTGCSSVASHNVFGAEDKYEKLTQLLQSADSDLRAQAQASSAYRDADGRWVACMSRKGYNFSSRGSIYETRWPDPGPTSPEIEAALADFDCAEEVGLEGIEAVVYRENLQVWLEKNPEVPADAAEARAEVIRTCLRLFPDSRKPSTPSPDATDGRGLPAEQSG